MGPPGPERTLSLSAVLANPGKARLYISSESDRSQLNGTPFLPERNGDDIFSPVCLELVHMCQTGLVETLCLLENLQATLTLFAEVEQQLRDCT